MQDGNGNVVASGSYDDNFGEGYARVVLTFQGTPGNIYFATGSHLDFVILSRDQPEEQPIEYDDYFFYEEADQLEAPGYDYFPVTSSFYGPGPNTPTRKHTITIANTTDSVAYPAPKVNLQVDFSGAVIATDLGYPIYDGMMGSNQLGLYGGQFGSNNGCVIGNEAVGTVTPANSPGPITIKRLVTSLACYTGASGSTPTSCPYPQSSLPADDTGNLIATNPQEMTPNGNANGQVFNLDIPGVTYENTDSNIIRLRVNFVDYAVDTDGKTVISQKVPYYIRISCSNATGTAQLIPVNPTDNSWGNGTTSILWNLH